MSGFFKAIGDVIGAVAGIAIAPLSVALGVSTKVIRAAIDSGCKTEQEIRKWVKDNT